MNASSHYVKGATHLHCQDSAATYSDDIRTIAVLSDGCSSSDKTEIGAALLPHFFIESFVSHDYIFRGHCYTEDQRNELMKLDLMRKMEELMEHTKLPASIFDATILALIATPQDNSLEVFLWGDGHFILQSHEGDLLHYSLRYASNAPYYISYSLDKVRDKQYHVAFGTSSALLKRNNSQEEELAPFQILKWPLDIVKTATITSDGVESFIDQDGIQVNVLDEITGYKSTVGHFVERRMTHFLKECAKKNIAHYDDVSVASIAV